MLNWEGEGRGLRRSLKRSFFLLNWKLKMCLINMLDMLVLEGVMVRHISMLKLFLKSLKGRVWLRGIGLFIICFKMSWILDFMLCRLSLRRLLKFNAKEERVLDNLKDYAVRALVNAVDHLGTVAYKLTDLLEQHTLDVSTMDLKVSTINQKLLTCQIYTQKEGLRQQQLLAFIPRHHKHYILPNSVNKKVHFSPHIQIDAKQNSFQTRTRFQSSGAPPAKTLSWHLASETKSTLKGTPHASPNIENPKFSAKASGFFHLLDNEESTWMKSSPAQIHLTNGVPTSSIPVQTLGGTRRDALDGSKPLTAFRSFDNANRRESDQTPTRSRSVPSAFFVKQKTPKSKAGSFS
ncbi:protein ABIL1-like isoform X3 [Cicer arietinum]|uniref:protein ABIL1-like isoform X3 n=2 Tax=Cicer arietinum TaxID=3827 RepID=UPI003CC53FED